ncbi:SAM-dependent methyltransferase [Brevundimonas diminuta]|uniref:SAM-dependent methyltransferase n=1 Tax=Brevundimonas diminuta TaxID=293 RepID=UPI0032086E94
MTAGSDTRAFWDARYADDAYRFGEAPNAFLARQVERLRPGLKVLSVADGEGRNGVWLAQQGLDVLTFDISPRAVEKAQALAAKRGVVLDAQIGGLDDWAWPEEAMDVVVGVFIQFVGPAARDRMFARMKAALKPGGLLLLEGYRPEQLVYGTGGPGVEENLYTDAVLRQAFADLQIERIDAYDAELNEGPGHSGVSALIDLIARKPG